MCGGLSCLSVDNFFNERNSFTAPIVIHRAFLVRGLRRESWTIGISAEQFRMRKTQFPLSRRSHSLYCFERQEEVWNLRNQKNLRRPRRHVMPGATFSKKRNRPRFKSARPSRVNAPCGDPPCRVGFGQPVFGDKPRSPSQRRCRRTRWTSRRPNGAMALLRMPFRRFGVDWHAASLPPGLPRCQTKYINLRMARLPMMKIHTAKAPKLFVFYVTTRIHHLKERLSFRWSEVGRIQELG